MTRRDRWWTAAPITAVAGVVVALAAAHVAADDDPVFAELLEAGILVVFAVAVFAVAARVAREDLSWDAVKRILAFTLGAAAVIGGLSAVFVAARVVSGEAAGESTFVVSIGGSLGASAGALIGYYVHRYETGLAEQAALTQRLTVLQRVLRHNVRNEVTIVDGVTQSLRERADDPAVAADLETIHRHVRRIHALAEKSQDLVGVWQTDDRVVVDAASALRDAASATRDVHPGVDLTVDAPATARVRAHPRVGLAFEEALDNAARHTDGAEITATVADAGDAVTVTVADTGRGIPRGEVTPLKQGIERPLDHATGLGLWLIYWLTEGAGAHLDVEARDGGGTVVTMTFPAA